MVFVNTAKAKELLGVHHRTLLNWSNSGKIESIRTKGNHRMYNVEKYLTDIKCLNNICKDVNTDLDGKERLNICYVRVSSKSQESDLQHQKNLMTLKYPNHLIIEDIGSGLNLAKRGIKKIIKLAIEGKVNELVVAHKDRLTRFGYELIEDIVETYSKGKIIVIEQKIKTLPEEELVKDVLTLMNVYVAKMNGLRKYKVSGIGL